MPKEHKHSPAGLTDYLHLHFIVLVWGFSSIIGVLIKVSALELVFWRTFMAAVLTLVWLKAEQKNVLLPVSKAWPLMLVGMITAAHWFTFFLSARIGNVSTCLAGLSTCTFFTSLLEPLLTRKRFRWLELLFGLLVGCGLYIIYMAEVERALGLLVGILSAFLAALFSVLNGRFVQRHPARIISLYELSGSAILAGVTLLLVYLFGAEKTPYHWPSLPDWGYIFILAAVCTVYAFSACLGLMHKFSIFSMNLTITLEPVYGIILAFLFFGATERMNTSFYLGTGIILASVLGFPVVEKWGKGVG